ncbi:Echinoderm microtubule-associated protein-like 1 [Hypsibius exemplaris]|uniref:Echinoderm microtubule-associated protein-like 1 n=1 Tax=Hypsibius exemplaris TaxID=2072580 RepID=A0A1W0X2K1_HYPEX|nr:Echinoderm microtubule-associated protein-like 1 [Hypsibius exemplaris]
MSQFSRFGVAASAAFAFCRRRAADLEDDRGQNSAPESIMLDGSVYSDEQMSSLDGEPNGRIDELEKRIRHQGDEIVLLRSVIAELVRRVGDLENAASRTRDNRSSHTLSGSTLTLPTKSSATRSTGRPSITSLSSPLNSSGGKLSSHHMSSESLQSSSTLNRQSVGSTSSYGLRNSPSMDRLATPRTSGGSTTARTFVTSSPSTAAKPTPMRKWTSNSDFQSGTNGSSASHTLPSPGHHANHSTLPSGTTQRRQYGSQAHLNDVQPYAGAAGNGSPAGLSTYRAAHKESVFNPDDGYLHVTIRGKGMNFHVPSVDCLSNSLTQPNPPPSQRLKLEWVYGYRGRDCRSNLHQIATGDTVYFIASVVVLVNLEESVQRHYLGHTDDIRCLTVHPNKMTIASGQTGNPEKKKRPGGSSPGPDEKLVHIRVWDSVSLNTLHVIGGNGDFDRGFCCLAFSKMDGGALLVAIDEAQDHVLTLWDWQKAGTRGDRIAVTNCGPDAVFACEFHPSVPNLLITCGKSNVTFWTVDGTLLTLSKVAGSFERVERPKFVLCLCFTENGDIITGDSSGNIISWGRAAGNRVRNIVTNAHPGGVFVLFCCSDGTLVSGGKDKRLVGWDQDLNRTGMEYELTDNYGTARAIAQTRDSTLLVGTNRNCVLQGDFISGFSVAVQGHFDEIWALATHPNHHQFATASYDHFLTLWSTSEKSPIWSMEMQDGVHAVAFHPDGDLIAVATISGRWFVLDTLTKEIISSQTVNGDTQDLLSSIKYSPDGRFIAVASVDRSIYIYQILEGGTKCMKLGKCVGHSSAVLCLDWSTDSQYLRSNSDNFELIYWNPSTLKQIVNAAMCRDVEWDSCNCILEYGVAGVWSETVQALSVDCTHSSGSRVLAVGDDGGKVKLFSYPAMSLKSLCHSYNGHSNHVSTVRFMHDDSRLISAGGRDASVLQWIVI